MKINEENLAAALSKEISTPNRKRTSRGPLHDRMTKFLPDFVDNDEDCCNIGRLAIALGMTPQGVYRMMRPNKKHRIEPGIAEALVELSGRSKRRDNSFRPASIQDFWEFVNV